jgi:hypothetical protein
MARLYTDVRQQQEAGSAIDYRVAKFAHFDSFCAFTTALEKTTLAQMQNPQIEPYITSMKKELDVIWGVTS